MKTNKLKSILIIFAILACISTICFATDNDAELLTATAEENTVDLSDVDLEESNYGNNELSDEEFAALLAQSNAETHSGDIAQFGGAIDIDQVIDGNAFLIGSDVKISGQINGDLFVLASNSFNIAKGAAIYGNVFVASPKVTLTGIVYNLYAVAQDFVCDYDGMAALDLKVVANNITFDGYIERHVYFAASDSMTFTKNACILGNLNYSANPDNVNIDPEATIRGETFASNFVSNGPANYVASFTISFITSLTFLLVILLALLLVRPSTIQKAASNLTTKPWKTLGFGALAFIAIPILAAIFFMINVFSTLAVVLCGIYFVLLALSTVIVTIGLAKFLDNKIEKTHSENSILAYVLIVGVALWLLTKIPVLGVLISIVVWMFGLGTIVVSLLPNKEGNKEPEHKQEQPKEAPAKKEDKPVKKEDKPVKEEKKEDNEDKKEE